MSNRILPVIVGPTGVGKTSVGIKLAEIMDGEIVSADSRQVYAGMEIGSGAPTRQEMENIPHHLIGFLSPHLRLSAGEFAKIASERIEEIFIMGKAPIVVGGSGFYIKALTEGLSPIPQPDMKIRADLSDEVELVGMTKMIAELRKVDPEYAEKVGLNNNTFTLGSETTDLTLDTSASLVVAEVTKVTTPTSDSTPNYTFSSSVAGTITYGGSCSSDDTFVMADSNTITFSPLGDGTYSNCTITVTDSGGNSETLNINSFLVDSSPAAFDP